jgi:hypothetical protein
MPNRTEHALVFDRFPSRWSASEDPSEDLVESPSLQTLREGAPYRCVELAVGAAFAKPGDLSLGLVVADGGHSDRYLSGCNHCGGFVCRLVLHGSSSCRVRHSERAVRALDAVRFSAVMDGGWGDARLGESDGTGSQAWVEVRQTRGRRCRNETRDTGDLGRRDDPRRTGGPDLRAMTTGCYRPRQAGCQTQGHEQKKDRNLARGCSGKEPIPTRQPADQEREKEEKQTNTTAVKRAQTPPHRPG